MDRRSFIIGSVLAFIPLEIEGRKRVPKHRKKRKTKGKKNNNNKNHQEVYEMPTYLYIQDRTSARWEPFIREAVQIVDDLVPDWYPTLVYQRMPVSAWAEPATAGAVSFYEAPVSQMVSPGAVGESEFIGSVKVPGHKGRIRLLDTYPANKGLIIHELHHTLCNDYGHDGWQTLPIPFDASRILLSDNNGG